MMELGGCDNCGGTHFVSPVSVREVRIMRMGLRDCACLSCGTVYREPKSRPTFRYRFPFGLVEGY